MLLHAKIFMTQFSIVFILYTEHLYFTMLVSTLKLISLRGISTNNSILNDVGSKFSHFSQLSFEENPVCFMSLVSWVSDSTCRRFL